MNDAEYCISEPINHIFNKRSIIMPHKAIMDIDEIREYLNSQGNSNYIYYYFSFKSLLKCIELYTSESISKSTKVVIGELIAANTNKLINDEDNRKKLFTLFSNDNDFYSCIISKATYYVDLLAILSIYSILNSKVDILSVVLGIYAQSSKLSDFVKRLYYRLSEIHLFRYPINEKNFYIYYDGFRSIEEKTKLFKLKVASETSEFAQELYFAHQDLEKVIPQKEKIVEKIEKNQFWDSEKKFPPVISIIFKYPNGKQGDVFMYLTGKYGNVTKKDELTYLANIKPKYKDEIIPLLCYLSGSVSVSENVLSAFLPHVFMSLQYSSRVMYKMKVHNALNKRIFAVLNRIHNETNVIYSKLLLENKSTPKWKSEYQLFSLVVNHFPDAIYQYHSDWLGSQSIDIFIPSISVGIEYQGQQHYEPIEYFGGNESYKYTVSRDEKKRHLCEKNKVVLLEWPYTYEITDSNLKNLFVQNGITI